MIIFWSIFLYHMVGFLIVLLLGGTCLECVRRSDGIEFFNPAHVYRHERVNWFGALFLALVFTALSPFFAVCYWFYKICTVGRRK